MTTEIKIPMLSMGMTEGEISGWLVSDGATVEKGTPIYAIESDKSVLEIDAPVGGVLRIIGVVGESYPVGETIGTIE